MGWTEYCSNYIFWWNCFFFFFFFFFLQKWEQFSMIQIVTNSYNYSLNGFKDIWHWKYVYFRTHIFECNTVVCWLTTVLRWTFLKKKQKKKKQKKKKKRENTWMQYCCILTYNSAALNISLKSRKYLNAILLYLKIQQYYTELFLYIKRIIQCKLLYLRLQPCCIN